MHLFRVNYRGDLPTDFIQADRFDMRCSAYRVYVFLVGDEKVAECDAGWVKSIVRMGRNDDQVTTVKIVDPPETGGTSCFTTSSTSTTQ